jgi:hypothetical protein
MRLSEVVVTDISSMELGDSRDGENDRQKENQS